MAENHLKGLPDIKESGFTLMELMIALMVIVVGVLAIWSMQMAAVNGNYTSRKITEAAVAGSDRVEKLMLMEYDEGDLTYDSLIHTPLEYDSDGKLISWQTSATGGDCSVQMTISDDTPISNVKKIDVTVSWVRAGQTKSITYVYYKGLFTNADAA
jgi:type IV pilus assembly protein PilV